MREIRDERTLATLPPADNINVVVLLWQTTEEAIVTTALVPRTYSPQLQHIFGRAIFHCSAFRRLKLLLLVATVEAQTQWKEAIITGAQTISRILIRFNVSTEIRHHPEGMIHDENFQRV